MENAIIPITTATFGEETQKGVNARDLHEFLEVGKDFSNWIKDRISQYGFSEDVDYVKTQDLSSPNLANAKSRAQIRIEYFLTLNMAKELSMVERNEKGKMARQYFIRCERELKEITQQQFQLPQTYSEALRQLAHEVEQREALEAKNLQLENKAKEDAPKVSFSDDVVATGAEMTITAAAKVLGIAPRKFFDWLRIKGYLYLQSNQATQRAIDSGWMVVRFAQIQRADGIEQKAYPHVTGKGLYFFYTRLLKQGVIERNQSLEMVA